MMNMHCNDSDQLHSDPEADFYRGIYRAPNEDMRVIEKLAERAEFLENSIKHSIIRSNLNLPQVD
jgi:hypothetical protein